MAIRADKMKYVSDVSSTIEEAWTKIENNRQRSVIVTDKGKVVGTLSDGDLRKAMLSRRLLSAPVGDAMNTNFTAVTHGQEDRGKNILLEKDIFLLPVVDKEMNLLDIITR